MVIGEIDKILIKIFKVEEEGEEEQGTMLNKNKTTGVLQKARRKMKIDSKQAKDKIKKLTKNKIIVGLNKKIKKQI